MRCRYCSAELSLTLIDLGEAPLSNAYRSRADLKWPEPLLPLHVLVCKSCWLVQTEVTASVRDVFPEDYAYFSSYSDTWLAHARDYVAAMVTKFGLGEAHLVVEVAANDGYLLQFVKERGIPCLGIEPTSSTACAARARGIETLESFFGMALASQLASQGRRADLIVANNVLAHVPDLRDFVSGFAALLKDYGVATFEFPHLVRLIEGNQFDTIYHEHYSYLSLTAVDRVFSDNRLKIVDVEELPTHGGSLRVFAVLKSNDRHSRSDRVNAMLKREAELGVRSVDYYRGFCDRAERARDGLREFLNKLATSGQKVAGYGAAAKGNTLLNYAGITANLLPYVVDRNPIKQGKYLPGCHIPIVAEEKLRRDRPDWVLILPWNLKVEIMDQLHYVREWGGRLFTAIPEIQIAPTDMS